MSIMDERTGYLGLPLVSLLNDLEDDNPRLNQALEIIDTAMQLLSLALGDLSKDSLGLDKVDNTSDADKPISTAMALALAGKLSSVPVTTVMSVTRVGDRVTAVTADGVVTSITYNANGTVKTVAYPRNGKTRTETYAYNNGVLTGMSAVEV